MGGDITPREAAVITEDDDAAVPEEGVDSDAPLQDAEEAGERVTPAQLTVVKFSDASGLTPLKRYAYRAWYSEQLGIPVAVAWYLTDQHTTGSYKRKGISFHEDPEVRNSPTTYDYMQSGYDRGHMCPSGDNKWNKTAQEQSFLMTNICPQNHNLNTGDWNDLEQRCRGWANGYGTIYIVCGPILRGTQHKRLKKKVTVPEAFYKVVMRWGDEPAAIGFIYENIGTSQPIEEAVRSVDEIEQLTGIDFFSALPDDIETRIEAAADLNDW
ncbi:MAG: DNA/RNA non-specific endonuclease [Prevotella sp.]|nr:DNA/RNA non-specific endonuclease [Prevotella sp.]